MWPAPLQEHLATVLEQIHGRPTVALASGDPMVCGIGTTLIRMLGTAAVRVLPTLSSPALARARMGWSAEESVVVTVVGRHEARLVREIAPGRRILLLTSGPQTPARVGQLLTDSGCDEASVTLLGDLGTDTETRIERTAREWITIPASAVPALHVLAVQIPHPIPTWHPWVGGLPDHAFDHDGQLTRRDLRACALARLRPAPGHHLWDVGAGAGSVGIEWMRTHPTCQATAIEACPQRADRIATNATRLGVPDLHVVRGRAPQALTALPAPDAVFIGGGATRTGVLETCLDALGPGGRLLAHAVTLETETLLAHALHTHGGELTRISVQTTAPVGTFTGWTPTRTVTQWALTIPTPP